MKKYDVPLALSTTGDTGLSLARMIFDMMELDELYQPLEYEGTFEDLRDLDEAECFRVLGIDPRSEERLERLVEDEFTLKNYDVALALATAGKITEARRVMERVNPKKELEVSDFGPLEKDELEKAREIQEIRNLHDRLLKKLKERNLPHPETPREDKTYFREIVAGWKRLGIEWGARATYVGHIDLELIEKKQFNKGIRKELSEQKTYGGYGALLPGLLKFIDYVVCEVGSNVAWIIEGKKKLNYKAIGQVIVLSDLFIEDNPTFSEVRKAIVCEETDPVLEATCKKNEIEVLTLD